MPNLLSPTTFVLIGALFVMYLIGPKSIIGVGILLVILLAVIYFNQNKLLYMPGSNPIIQLYLAFHNHPERTLVE